ncbi:MAG: hypothetical protein KGM99_04365, partial [Burkholderiales bacterium]|nr:hypothetical protein [Burkholderiales bacterium]
GLGLLIALVSMLPNASYLQLTPEGFTMRSLYRSHFFRWKDVTAFAVGRVVSNKMVMFNFAPTYQGPSKFRSFNASLTGYEAGLPDSYGMSHEALADLLNQYKTASRDS